jgi:hypothetical protein
MAKIRDLLVFYGDGERIFADFLAPVETKLRSTEETELCRLMRAYGSDKGSHWHNYTILYAANTRFFDVAFGRLQENLI